MCVRISLFQAIENVHIYLKVTRELDLRILDRRRKDPQIIHVMGKMSELMIGGVLRSKYSDPMILVVNVQIKFTLIPNA